MALHQSSILNNSNLSNNASNHFPPKFHKRLLLRHDQKKVEVSGTSESGMFAEIMNKEFINPYDNSSDSVYKSIQRNNSHVDFSNKWSLNTTKVCSQPDKIPHIQQFKQYNFPNVTNETKEKYQLLFQNTDNIAPKIPKENFLRAGNPFLDMKRKFLFYNSIYFT